MSREGVVGVEVFMWWQRDEGGEVSCDDPWRLMMCLACTVPPHHSQTYAILVGNPTRDRASGLISSKGTMRRTVISYSIMGLFLCIIDVVFMCGVRWTRLSSRLQFSNS